MSTSTYHQNNEFVVSSHTSSGNDAPLSDITQVHSGVGVLDKAAKILDALEKGPTTLASLVGEKIGRAHV